MSQLQGKVGVLYVLENDAKSHRALSIAQFLPEIYIQYVGLLSEDKIPPWLKEVPTCVTLSDRKLHTGTDALELLGSLHAIRQQQPPPQYPPQQQPPPQYPPQQPGTLRGQELARPPSTQQRFPPTPQQQQGKSMAPPPPPPPEGVLKGSLQPASGTGQYGCSLDMAFSSTEESPAEQQLNGKAGKVDQRDIDSYLRLREQSGKLKAIQQ